jgi:predicted transcriptional regulator
MTEAKYQISPEELVVLHKCLSSKVCLRIFHIMKRHRRLNVSAISRKARCCNKTSVKHLRNMARLNIIEEELYSGLHKFALKREPFIELIDQTVKLLEEDKEENAL